MRWKTMYFWLTIIICIKVCYSAFPWTHYICIGGKSTSTITVGISDIQCLHKCYGEMENEPKKYKALLYGNNTCYCMPTPNLEEKSDSRDCKYVVFQGDSKMLKTDSMYFVQTYPEVTIGNGGRLKIFYFTNTESTSEAMVFAIDSLNTTTPSDRFIPSLVEFFGDKGGIFFPSREVRSNLTNTVTMRKLDINKIEGRTLEFPFKVGDTGINNTKFYIVSILTNEKFILVYMFPSAVKHPNTKSCGHTPKITHKNNKINEKLKLEITVEPATKCNTDLRNSNMLVNLDRHYHIDSYIFPASQPHEVFVNNSTMLIKMTRYILATFQLEVHLTVKSPSVRKKSFSTVLKTSSFKNNVESAIFLNASDHLIPEAVKRIQGFTLQVQTEDGKKTCIGDPNGGKTNYKICAMNYCTTFRVYQRTFMDTKGYCMHIKDGESAKRIRCSDIYDDRIMISRSSPEMHLYIVDGFVYASENEKNQFERVKTKFGWGTPPTENLEDTPYNATSSTLDETSLICVHKHKKSVYHCIHLSSGVLKKIAANSYYTHYYGNIICGKDTWNNNYCTNLKTGRTMIKTDKKISAMNLMLKYSTPNITMNDSSLNIGERKFIFV